MQSTLKQKKISQDSGEKNCFHHLIKVLSKHYPEQVWHETYKKMKSDSNRDDKLQWKAVFKRIAEEAFRIGPQSVEWKTLLKLLEITRNVKNYLTYPNGRQIIKWKSQQKGRDSFVQKCEREVVHTFFSLMRSLVDNSGLSLWAKSAFTETLEQTIQRDCSERIGNYYSEEENSDKFSEFFLRDCTSTEGNLSSETFNPSTARMTPRDYDDEESGLSSNISNAEVGMMEEEKPEKEDDGISDNERLRRKVEYLEKKLKEKDETIEQLWNMRSFDAIKEISPVNESSYILAAGIDEI